MHVKTKNKVKIVLSAFIILNSIVLTLFSAHAQLPFPNVYEQVTTVDAEVPVDFDEDGIHNWYELQYGMDPLDPSDAALDYDGDGLTNLTEFQYLTSPLNRDTDGGGVWDDLEIREGKDPLNPYDDFDMPGGYTVQPDRGDSDGDGVGNTTEDEYGTDKHNIDTDGDGLDDFQEIYNYPTSPTESDSDLDGLNDYQEIKVHLTDPNNRDSDFDGLTDYLEIFIYGTNPLSWDTDEGGMSDNDELENDSNPLKKDDDFKFVWEVYYGNKPNQIYSSLEDYKFNIYQGMDLTLEAIRPENVNKITIEYNDKKLETFKEFFKVKLLSPDEPGLYKIKLSLSLDDGRTITTSRFIEVRQRGKVISRIDGTFNEIYDDYKIFDNKPVEGAKIEIYEYDEVFDKLKLFEADISGTSQEYPAQSNPQYTDANGTYLLNLKPGNYLIKISKPEFGTKEILYNTSTNTVYSEDVYLVYNYDVLVWGGLYLATFLFVWLTIQLFNLIKQLAFYIYEIITGHKKAF